LENTRHHSRDLYWPFRHGQYADQISTIPSCQNTKPALRQMLPPGRQPFMREEHAIGSAGFEKRIPLVVLGYEFFDRFDGLYFHISPPVRLRGAESHPTFSSSPAPIQISDGAICEAAIDF